MKKRSWLNSRDGFLSLSFLSFSTPLSVPVVFRYGLSATMPIRVARRKRLLMSAEKVFFFFFFFTVPVRSVSSGPRKTSPLFSTGKQIKTDADSFTIFFFKGDLQCVKVSLRCFVYYLFVCGPRWEERINRRGLNEPLMNGRCGLPSYGSRGDDVVFKSIWIELIKLFSFQNRKEEKS